MMMMRKGHAEIVSFLHSLSKLKRIYLFLQKVICIITESTQRQHVDLVISFLL